MMGRVLAALSVTGLWAGGLAGPASAQVIAAPFPAVSGPAVPCRLPGTVRFTVTPYLNLIRGGNAAVNYYGLVRPITQLQRAVEELQAEKHVDARVRAPWEHGLGAPLSVAFQPVGRDRGLGRDSRGTELPVTGHGAGFQGHWKYFQHLGAGLPPRVNPPGMHRFDVGTLPRMPGAALGPLGDLGDLEPAGPGAAKQGGFPAVPKPGR